MTNSDFIKEYINGTRQYNAYCHLAYKGDTLWNYSTVICVIDREKKKAIFNCRKYSNTTSRIQSNLKGQLHREGFAITDYVGESANFWNCGYVGAGNWKASEAKQFDEWEKKYLVGKYI